MITKEDALNVNRMCSLFNESKALKIRKQTIEVVIKNIYEAIELAKDNGKFSVRVALPTCSIDTHKRIVESIYADGFNCTLFTSNNILNIDWM